MPTDQEIAQATPIGAIPQSNALAEASPDSISDLMSKDPEGFSRQDRKRIVEFFQKEREKFGREEQEGRKSKKVGGLSSSSAKATDLGL